MAYDNFSWHSGGDFPEGSPDEYGGTHIALFLRWCFVKGWAGEMHTERWPEDVRKVIDGTLTATEFLFKHCDGKLIDADFNADGNAFASEYYGKDGLYLDDYATKFEKLMYVAPERDHDFAAFSAMLEDRFRSGVLTRHATKPKPWWRFW